MRLICVLTALTVAALLGWSLPGSQAPADAATVVRLDIQGLVDRADWVVEGRVIGQRTIERAGGGLDTELTLDVAYEFLRPTTGEGDRRFRLPGGVRSDGSGMLIPGMPTVSLGEEVLLFLTESGPEGRRLPVGLTQGKYSLLTDRQGTRRALRDGDGTRLLGAGRQSSFGLETRAYAKLRAEVEAAVNGRRAYGQDR